jgi:hypothetical protein
MATQSTDPTETFETKLVAFSATLSGDELQVLHDVLHLAREGASDVHGFAMPTGVMADPCEGGEVTFPNTLNMLGSLHLNLHKTVPSPLNPNRRL